MSTPLPPAVDPEGSGSPGPIRCPRCSATVGPYQDWCLECGAPARTRLARVPNWRAPVAVVTVVALVAGIALAVAFAALTDSDEDVPGVEPAPTAASTPAPPGSPAAPPVSIPAAPGAPAPGATAPAAPAPPAPGVTVPTTPPPAATAPAAPPAPAPTAPPGG